MASKLGMLAGVLVGGAVTTKSYPAFLAGAEVNPVGADPDALNAFKLLGQLDRFDRVKMDAASIWHLLTVDDFF